jgi:hypothetical protein
MVKFQVREVCADFEELRGFQGDCQREDISDEGPGGSGWKALVVECNHLIMLLLYGI